MIYDSLNHTSCYRLGPRFDLAFDYLSSGRPATDSLGRHDLDGDRVFVNVDEYETRPREQCRFEAHLVYADVQYLVTGNEHIAVAPLSKMTLTEPYDPARDVGFFDGEGTPVALGGDLFLVLFPQDAHMPCMVIDRPQPVRKVVVKVRIDA